MLKRFKCLLTGSVLLAAGALATGLALAADDGVATIRQLMLGIVIPASDGVFGVASKAPENDTEWELIEADSMAEAERITAADPYEKVDLFESKLIKPFLQVVPEVK